MYKGTKLLSRYLFNKSWMIAILMLALTIIVSSTLITLPRPDAAHAVRAAAPALTVTPSSQAYYSQTKLKVQGFNFPHSISVTIYWNYTDNNNPGTAETRATTNTQGNFTASFTLPLAPTGNYTIAGVYVVNSHSQAVTTTFQLWPNLDATPRATGVGSRFTISGQAFSLGEAVNIYWNYTGPGTGTLLTTATSDAQTDTFQATVPVP